MKPARVCRKGSREAESPDVVGRPFEPDPGNSGVGIAGTGPDVIGAVLAIESAAL